MAIVGVSDFAYGDIGELKRRILLFEQLYFDRSFFCDFVEATELKFLHNWPENRLREHQAAIDYLFEHDALVDYNFRHLVFTESGDPQKSLDLTVIKNLRWFSWKLSDVNKNITRYNGIFTGDDPSVEKFDIDHALALNSSVQEGIIDLSCFQTMLAPRILPESLPVLSRFVDLEAQQKALQKHAALAKTVARICWEESGNSDRLHERLREFLESSQNDSEQQEERRDESRNVTVLRVILDQFPVIDDSVSMEQVLEIRSDPDLRSKFLALRNWISETARSDLQPQELEEKVEYLLAQYADHLRFAQLKYTQGSFEAVITTSADILEDLVKFKWSDLAKGLFKVREAKADLLEAELKAPGRELAYVHEMHQRLGR